MNSKNIESVVAEIDFRIGELENLKGKLIAYDLAYELPSAAVPVTAPATAAAALVKRPYRRRAGLPALAVGAPSKPGRKKKPVQTPEQAAASVKTLLTGNGQPTTFAGACKRVLREGSGPLTITQVFEAVKNQWPDLCADRDVSACAANLSYWTSKNYSAKSGMGSQATYKVVDQEFFQESET